MPENLMKHVFTCVVAMNSLVMLFGILTMRSDSVCPSFPTNGPASRPVVTYTQGARTLTETAPEEVNIAATTYPRSYNVTKVHNGTNNHPSDLHVSIDRAVSSSTTTPPVSHNALLSQVGTTALLASHNIPTTLSIKHDAPNSGHTIQNVSVLPSGACTKDYSQYDPFSSMLATRKEQYKRFWREHPKFKAKASKHHDFYATQNLTIKNLGHDPGKEVKGVTHGVELREKDGFIVLLIREFSKGKPSKGGSSFHSVVATGDMLHMCGYEDFFNGTYLLQCAMYARCATLNVTLVHVNFKQHEGVAKRQDVAVFSGRVCLGAVCYQGEKPAARWEQGEEHMYWHTQGYNYPMDAVDICPLLDRMVRDRFYMIGSSHMEHQFMYVNSKCARYVRDLRKRVFYVPARFGKDVKSAIQKFITRNNTKRCSLPKSSTTYECNQPQNKTFRMKGHGLSYSSPCSYNSSLKTGLLFQVGSWDLSYNGLKSSLDDLIPQLDTTLYKLAKFKKANPSVNMAVMSPPPFYSYRYAETRNNDMIQILDDALRNVTQKHGIMYVSSYHLMYTVYDHTAPQDAHYIRCKGYKCKYGDPGVVAIHRAIQALANATPCH